MSVTNQEIEITNRFFQAIEILKSKGKIRSLRQITTMYNLNYGNVHTMMSKPETARIKLELLANICKDFEISAEWLLFGVGQVFLKRKHKNKISQQDLEH